MLPPYVYDLIAAVQQWEDEHGDTSMCFGHVLDAVPARERDRAAAIGHYQRERIRMETALEDDPVPTGRGSRGSIEALSQFVRDARVEMSRSFGLTAVTIEVLPADLARMGHPGLSKLDGMPIRSCPGVWPGHLRILATTGEQYVKIPPQLMEA